MSNSSANLARSVNDLPEETQITPEVRKSYRAWRVRIMYSIMIGYAAFYLVRMNFPMTFPALQAEFGYSKTDLGKIITLFSIIYGIGKFVNGYISDRSNARYFMTIGLFCSAAISLFMGFGSGFIFFGILWGFNAWFQSMGWPPVVRILTHWYSPKELGTKWGFWASSHEIGGAAIVVLAGFLIENYGWRYAFFAPSIIAMGVSLFLFNRLRDTPKSVGLPPVEQYKEDTNALAALELEEDKISHLEQIRRVILNPLLWYVGLGNMFLYVVRMGVFTWAPTFLQEMKGYTPLSSGWQLATYEISGILGGLCAGWLSDKVFQGRRGPVSVLFMLGLSLSLVYFWQVKFDTPLLDAVVMFLVGFLVYGPQVLAGVAAADFGTKKAAGTATGLIGTFGYLGAAISGYGIAKIVDLWGWSSGFLFFITAAFLGAICFALTWRHRARVLDGQRA